MTLNEIIARLDNDVEESGVYKSSYRIQRQAFWVQNTTVILSALSVTLMLMTLLSISVALSVSIFTSLAMLGTWLMWAHDTSPQSLGEVKNEHLGRIIGAVMLQAYEANTLKHRFDKEGK